MSGTSQRGLEVRLGTDPELIAQPYAEKYLVNKIQGATDDVLSKPLQSSRLIQKRRDRRNLFWALALITVSCLAVALGGGLGAGLAAHQRSIAASKSASISSVAANPVITTVQSDKFVTTTSTLSTFPGAQSGRVLTITSAPWIPPTTQPDNMFTTALGPSTSPTMPSPVCPDADRSTYIATNKPSPVASPAGSPPLEITNTSLPYEIFCSTNFIADPPVMDLQTLTDDVPTFKDCLNACALYSFRTKPANFPAFACTGVAWVRDGSETHICWLKSNVTASSTNGTDIYPGIDGAVMILF